MTKAASRKFPALLLALATGVMIGIVFQSSFHAPTEGDCNVFLNNERDDFSDKLKQSIETTKQTVLTQSLANCQKEKEAAVAAATVTVTGKTASADIKKYEEKLPISFVTVDVTVAGTKPFRFSSYPRDVDPTVSGNIQDNKTPYCPPVLIEMIRDCVKEWADKGGCVFADVGSNIGSCAVSAGVLGARVYAFEALKDNAYLTYLNVYQNGLTENVKVFPFGVSNERKQIDLYRLPKNLGHNMVGGFQDNLKSEYLKDLTTVALLDDFIKERVHLMKMDVEGHEYLALKGATQLLANYGVDRIFFEFTPKLLTHDFKDPDLAEEFLLFLKEKAGFSLYRDYSNGVFLNELETAADIKAVSHPPQDHFVFFDLFAAKK